MKIALYGGSFDPVHVGHVLAATVVLATEDVDELWFTPTYKHMLGKSLSDFEHRIEMTRLVAKEFGNRASVTRAEQRLAKRPGFIGSTTIDLVRCLKEEWPNDHFRFVLGSDLLDHFKTWEGAEEIVELAPPIIINRAGYATPGALPLHQLIVPDISSTSVRAAILRGEDVHKLVPRAVMDYIQRHRLYQE